MPIIESLFGVKCKECGQKIRGEKFPNPGTGWLCQNCKPLLDQKLKREEEERNLQIELDEAVALVERGDQKAVSISAIPRLILELLHSKDKGWEKELAFERALLSFGAEAVKPLIHTLNIEQGRHRYKMVDILGRIGDKQAVPHIVKLLNDPDSFVRRRSADALGKIQDPSAVPHLVQQLNDKDWIFRGDVVKALGAIKSVEAIPGLIKVLTANQDYEWGPRKDAVEALLAIHDEQSIPGLQIALTDKVHHVREAAVKALRLLGKEMPEQEPLVKDIEYKTEQDLVSLLRDVAHASMGSAPAHLDTYDKRRETATEIGRELYRRGGTALMKKALDEGLGAVPGQRTIDQFWNGIGGWMG